MDIKEVMKLKLFYKDAMEKDMLNIKKSFTTRRTIEKKLFPYHERKYSFIENNDNSSDQNILENESDYTRDINYPYDIKIYDGYKISDTTRQQLDFFNNSQKDIFASYQDYKENNGAFIKDYFYCKNLQKSQSLINCEKDNCNEQFIIDLAKDYKKRKNYKINVNKFNKDIMKSNALMESSLNSIKMLYILEPELLTKNNKSKNSNNINKNNNTTKNKDSSQSEYSLDNLKDYKYITKLNLLIKRKINDYIDKSYFNEQNKQLDNDQNESEKKSRKESLNKNSDEDYEYDSNYLKEQIMKNQEDIKMLKLLLLKENKEPNKSTSNNKKDVKVIYNPKKLLPSKSLKNYKFQLKFNQGTPIKLNRANANNSLNNSFTINYFDIRISLYYIYMPNRLYKKKVTYFHKIYLIY